MKGLIFTLIIFGVLLFGFSLEQSLGMSGFLEEPPLMGFVGGMIPIIGGTLGTLCFVTAWRRIR